MHGLWENVMIFKNDNRMIKITGSVMKIMLAHLQTSSNFYESGGILIGRENTSNDNLIVDFATSPMPKDIQKRDRFIRKDSGHLSYYQNLYTENDGIYRYVGEWHTHPECFPHNSVIDSRNWGKIAKEDPYNRIHYHLILGTTAINVWEVKYPLILRPKLVFSMQIQ